MCQECRNLTIDDFDKQICQFKNRFDLLYFLINTLLHITYNGWYYWYCRDTDKCLLGLDPSNFRWVRKKYTEKMFDYNFLIWSTRNYILI